MSLNKSVSSISNSDNQNNQNPWLFDYPNNADFNFNYYHLLESVRNSSIANSTKPNLKIAIIGAGIAGLTAARELFRSGYTNLDIYEASDRIGGRAYSKPVDTEYNKYTTYELGAMRMPFFTDRGSKNCVLDYYCSLFDIQTISFPNPGSEAVKTTGVYVNRGQGATPSKLTTSSLLLWESGTVPPDPKLKSVYEKWNSFADKVISIFREKYGTEYWEEMWQNIVQEYWQMNFRQLAYLPKKEIIEGDYYFGGLGMTEEEVELFYVIGVGDGSWGAFYDISCLYIFRTLLSGYATNHKLITGLPKALDKYGSLPIQKEDILTDSLGQTIDNPRFLGVQTLTDSLFYFPVKSQNVKSVSPYEATKDKDYDTNIFLKTTVKSITRQADGQITLELPSGNTKNYDSIIITPTTWALESSSFFNNFDFENQIPHHVLNSIKQSHWITSCKVFFPLIKKYWEGNISKIPQVITTDSFLHDVYAYAVEDDAGVLLVSYTWEDDANKLLASSHTKELQDKLAKDCLEFLDKILMGCENIKEKISDFVDTSKPLVFQWALQPTYRGCAKLYRGGSQNQNYSLLTYNQKYSKESGVYFAGEAYSLEGGWAEPAFRLGLDAAIHLMNNNDAIFNNGFSMDLYPKYSSWKPSLNKKSTL